MAEERKGDSGWIAPNKGASENPKRPNLKGKVWIQNVEWEIAAWERSGDKGPYWSLKFSPPYKKPDDDIPF